MWARLERAIAFSGLALLCSSPALAGLGPGKVGPWA